MGKVHTSSVKPFLTPENMAAHIDFCKSYVNLQTNRFNNMFDYIHIDEKWYYLTKNCRRYYLGKDVDIPRRTSKSKHFKTKVMFLGAVARPRWDSNNNRMFDGKLGIWPFTEVVKAQRTSANRPAGTLITKALTSVTTDVYQKWLIEWLLPAIKENFPLSNHTIKIQQDNARPHIQPQDPTFLQAAQRLGLNVELVYQPPNSPDLNVLDLGYFNSIQSLQEEEAPTNIDELVEVVENSYAKFNTRKLNNVFLTLQKVMEAVILCNGSNSYKLPHISKEALERRGELPISITVSLSYTVVMLREYIHK